MVLLRLIFIFLAAASSTLNFEPKFYPQKSTENILINLSSLLPKDVQSLPVTDTKVFDDFCNGTMMECAQSITNGRSVIVDVIKTRLHQDFKELLENYVVVVSAVLDGMVERHEKTNAILDVIGMSQSRGYAVLEFLYDNGVAIDDVLGLYIIYSDLTDLCKERIKAKKQTVKQAVESLTNLSTNVVPLSENELETKKNKLLSIHKQIDMLAKTPLEVNKYPQWMTANVLKWKKLLLSMSPVKTAIGKIVCDKNGLDIFSWFDEIKTTADPKNVAMFYTEVGNAIIYKVRAIAEQQSYSVKDLLFVFMESLRAIDEKTCARLLSCESEDRKKLFLSINEEDSADIKDYKCEVLDSEKMENTKKQILESEKNKKKSILKTYNSMVNDLNAFISSVEFFANFMYNDRRFSLAQYVFEMPLGDLKNVYKICSKMGYDYQMLNKLKTIIEELNLSEPILPMNSEKKYNVHSNHTITIDFVKKNTEFMKDLNNLL